jgi:hypothetical protein
MEIGIGIGIEPRPFRIHHLMGTKISELVMHQGGVGLVVWKRRERGTARGSGSRERERHIVFFL